MSRPQAAERLLEQLRTQMRAASGEPPFHFTELHLQQVIDGVLAGSSPEQQRDPQYRASLERELQDFRGEEEYMSRILTKMYTHIEATAATRIKGPEGAHHHLHIGHLETGQLNAVTMLVPGYSDTYLVLFEDQLWTFARRLSEVVALALPGDERDGHLRLAPNDDDLAERLRPDGDIANWFGAVILDYVVKGRFPPWSAVGLTPARQNLSFALETGLEYFVLAHEYTHAILGHPNSTRTARGVLPMQDVEALEYSWQMEYQADLVGMILSIPAYIKYQQRPLAFAYMGTCLFFDALEIADRAAALLETGDENFLRIGSHPPNPDRLRQVRNNLLRFLEAEPSSRDDIETALLMADAQHRVIDHLWNTARPVFSGLRRHTGVRPHPKWRITRKDIDTGSA